MSETACLRARPTSDGSTSSTWAVRIPAFSNRAKIGVTVPDGSRAMRYRMIRSCREARLAFEHARSPSVAGVDETKQLVEALRLAVDPPGGVSIDALHDLVRGDERAPWDIATMADHVGVSRHTLRYYERIGLIDVGRDSCGHRLYDAATVRRVVFLTRMRTAGMPISATCGTTWSWSRKASGPSPSGSTC